MEYSDYRILECLLITNDSIVTEANISLSNFLNDNKDYFAMIMRHLPDMLHLANTIIKLNGAKLTDAEVFKSRDILKSCKSDMEACRENKNKLINASGILNANTDDFIKQQVIAQLDKNSSKLTTGNRAQNAVDTLDKACKSIDRNKISDEFNKTHSVVDTDSLLWYFLLVAPEFIKIIINAIKLIKKYKD